MKQYVYCQWMTKQWVLVTSVFIDVDLLAFPQIAWTKNNIHHGPKYPYDISAHEDVAKPINQSDSIH